MIMAAYVSICLIFGTTFLAIKVGVDAGMPPFLSAGLRFFLAGGAMLLWMSLRGRTKFRLLPHKESAAAGALLTFGTFATLYWAEQHVSSGLAAVLSATGPIMILLLQTGSSRQRPPLASLLGCLIGFTGVLLLVLPGLTFGSGLLWMAGCVAVLAGEVCYASGTLYSRRVIQRYAGTSPVALNAAQMFYGGLFTLLLSFFTEEVRPETLLTGSAAGSLLYLVVFGSMIGHTLYYWLLARTNPVFPSTWLYISPPIAVFVGFLVYDEPLTPVMLLGVFTIVAGTVLVNAEGLKSLLSRPAPHTALPKK